MRIVPKYLKVFTPLSLIIFMNTGCITFYSYEKVNFRLIDRIDKIPVPDAKIEVYYASIGLLNRPQPEYAYTDENGKAVLNIALKSWPLGFGILIDINDEYYDGLSGSPEKIKFHQPEVLFAAKKRYLLEILQKD